MRRRGLDGAVGPSSRPRSFVGHSDEKGSETRPVFGNGGGSATTKAAVVTVS